MSQRLPPLNTLRAFEVAARNLSFTQAALELHVTPSAVSHQIKILEDDLGVRLFRRENNKLLLTDAGACLVKECTSIFARLAVITQQVREHGSGSKLNIALRPYFAQNWFMPRVVSFWERHPDIDLALHHTIKLPSPSDAAIDIAIVWGDGNFPDFDSRLLINGDLTPVCSPRILRSHGARLTPDILRDHVLLDEESPANWDLWLESAGQPKLRPRKRISIDDTNVRLHAAIDGQGFALTCLSLMGRELKEGQLVAPFDYALSRYSYYMIYKHQVVENPKARAFIDWLVDDATLAIVPGL